MRRRKVLLERKLEDEWLRQDSRGHIYVYIYNTGGEVTASWLKRRYVERLREAGATMQVDLIAK